MVTFDRFYVKIVFMKRIFFAIIAVLTLSVGLAKPATAANLNDFTISDYQINYQLSRDDERRSILKTTEKITAEFPSVGSVNHGIERYIPSGYDSHGTSLKITNVSDEAGATREYTTYESGDFTVLRIGDPDVYASGSQTYIISYQQRDVTRYFADTGRDEFYWDTNGTDWKVPIDALKIQLEIDQDLAGDLSGNTACYFGGYGENRICQLDNTDDKLIYNTEATNLSAGSNVTIAVGFNGGTFAAYQMTFWEKFMAFWILSQVATGLIALLTSIFLAVRYFGWSKRKKALGTIVPEYVPPKNTSVVTAASIVGSDNTFTAQLIDLAVRHFVRISETKAKTTFGAAEYKIEIIKSTDGLLPEEQEFLKDLFGNLAVGSSIDTDDLKNDPTLSLRLQDNDSKLKKLMREKYGLRAKDETKSRWFRRAGLALLISGLILLSIPLVIAAILAYILGAILWPLTDSGVELHRYLLGLKMYISVAETERLRMLQSPEGAEKVSINTDDPAKMVKLYERVLPYAILFGQEKEWNARLGQYYEAARTQPDWFVGSGNMLVAASLISSLNNLTNSMVSTAASASSLGGSGGGGFSGGGGGGGGGGGW